MQKMDNNMSGKNITIYHTNDLHNRHEAFDFLSGVGMNGNTLLLDAGDAIGGSSTIFRFHETAIDRMNDLGYHALAMGNRELNYIRWVLKIRAGQAKFPILSANLEDLTGTTGDFYRSHIIKEISGLKVGIFGLTPVQYNDDSNWLPLLKFRFLDPIETSVKMVKLLRKEVDLLILLSHLGIDTDRNIAEKVSGIDLIIGGHTHTLLEEPLKLKDTYIFQAGCYGEQVGKIDLEINQEAGQAVTGLKYRLIPVKKTVT